jgi:hypothetical protein
LTSLSCFQVSATIAAPISHHLLEQRTHQYILIIADVDIFYKGYFSRMPVSKAYNDMEQLRNMGTVAVVDLKMILGRKNSGME